jgi:hypothetical protein
MVHTVTWLASALLAISYVWAEPLQASFSRCSSKATASSSLVVSSVFADLLSRERADELGLIAGGDKVLRLDVYGDVGQDLVGFNNETEKLGEYPVMVCDGRADLCSNSVLHHQDPHVHIPLLDHVPLQLSIPRFTA